MTGPINNNSTIRQVTTPTAAQPTAPAPAAVAPQPTAFAPPAATAGSVQNAANPSSGFTSAPATATPASAPQKPAGPTSLADFKALAPGPIDVSKYDQINTAYKSMPKDDRKAALKYLASTNQFGLEKFLKDSNGGGGGFLSGLGNALGEALFGGNR